MILVIIPMITLAAPKNKRKEKELAKDKHHLESHACRLLFSFGACVLLPRSRVSYSLFFFLRDLDYCMCYYKLISYFSSISSIPKIKEIKRLNADGKGEDINAHDSWRCPQKGLRIKKEGTSTKK